MVCSKCAAEWEPLSCNTLPCRQLIYPVKNCKASLFVICIIRINSFGTRCIYMSLFDHKQERKIKLKSTQQNLIVFDMNNLCLLISSKVKSRIFVIEENWYNNSMFKWISNDFCWVYFRLLYAKHSIFHNEPLNVFTIFEVAAPNLIATLSYLPISVQIWVCLF